MALHSVPGRPGTVRCSRTGAVIAQERQANGPGIPALCKDFLFSSGLAHGKREIERLERFVVYMLRRFKEVPETESELGVFLAREFPDAYPAAKRVKGPVPVAIELLRKLRENEG